MIKFQNITKIYPFNLPQSRPTVALENISFEIKPKEFVSIVGKSGAGKTTLLKLLLVEEKPTSGKVFFEGQNVHKINSEELPELRKKIGAIFQDYKLLPSKTAYENVAYAMEVIGASDKEIARDVPKVLEIVGLSERKNNFPAELSQGERQRVAVARALIHRPDVILADEPTGNLDPYHTLEIIQLLLKIHEIGTTVILATHNKEIINKLGKRVITLKRGKLIRDREKGRFIL
ncbi:MAG: cell division ATP-binding protein FtsE [Candidatus Nealsonbacteria bacterium]|nr:MAG: cell division ATP-binding protein FtsE [Candidatus Nealsonbacteria bacterium]